MMRIGSYLLVLIWAVFWASAGFSQTEAPDHSRWLKVESQAKNALQDKSYSQQKLEDLAHEVNKWRVIWQREVNMADTDGLTARIDLLEKQLIALNSTLSDGEKKQESSEISQLRASLSNELEMRRTLYLRAQVALLSANALAYKLRATIRNNFIKRLTRKSDIPFGGIPFERVFEQEWPHPDLSAWPSVLQELAQKLRNKPLALWALLLSLGSLLAVFLIKALSSSRSRDTDGAVKIGPERYFLAHPWLSIGGLILVTGAGFFFRIIDFSGPATLEIPGALYWTLIAILYSWGFGCLMPAYKRYLSSEIWCQWQKWLPIMALSFGVHLIVSAAAHTHGLSEHSAILLGLLPFGFSCYALYRIAHSPHLANKSASNSADLPETTMNSLDIRLCSIIKLSVFFLLALVVFQRIAAASWVLYGLFLTLATYATLKLLWGMVTAYFGSDKTDEETGLGALMPIIVNTFIALAFLPIFMLIWGEQASGFVLIWDNLGAGFVVAGIRLTPASIAIFLTVLALGVFLIRIAQRTLKTVVLPRTGMDAGLQNALNVGFGYVALVLILLIAISTAGINLTSLAIVAGALSLGIGFGLQNIVSNFVSGIILLIERPIAEGDCIDVGGKMGYVRDISVRSTRIETFDRSDIIVPNAALISDVVTNYTRGNTRGRLIMPVNVSYDSDLRKVETILQEIAEAEPQRLKSSPPSVFLMNFAAYSIEFEIRLILADISYKLDARSRINHLIHERLTEAGIEIPFPQQDIRLRKITEETEEGA